MIEIQLSVGGSGADLKLNDMLTAAGVLLGFQITILHWRITREAELSDTQKTNEQADPLKQKNEVSFAAADYLGIINIVILGLLFFAMQLVVGPFIPQTSARILASCIILLVGHIVSLGAHYSLYNNKRQLRPPEFTPCWEKVLVIIFGGLATLSLVFAVI